MLSIRQYRTSALWSLLLVGVLLFQFGAFNPFHDDDHGRHCCPACHAGHISATAESRLVLFIPPAGARRFFALERELQASEAAVVAQSSRAPPTA